MFQILKSQSRVYRFKPHLPDFPTGIYNCWYNILNSTLHVQLRSISKIRVYAIFNIFVPKEMISYIFAKLNLSLLIYCSVRYHLHSNKSAYFYLWADLNYLFVVKYVIIKNFTHTHYTWTLLRYYLATLYSILSLSFEGQGLLLVVHMISGFQRDYSSLNTLLLQDLLD